MFLLVFNDNLTGFREHKMTFMREINFMLKLGNIWHMKRLLKSFVVLAHIAYFRFN